MKKGIVLFVILFTIFSINVNAGNADGIDAYITGSNVNLRNCSNTSSSCIILAKMPSGSKVSLDSKELHLGSGCDDGWYKGTYNDINGYMCSSYVKIDEPFVPSDPNEFNTYKEKLIADGFLESYAIKLAELHDKYPLWEFVPVKNELNFSSAVSAETIEGKSCLYTSEQGYYLTGSKFDYLNDTFGTIDVGCFATNYQTNAYYIDPRNFLDEKNIFMFEEVRFNSSIHTTNTVDAVVVNNNNLKMYTNDFYNANTVNGKTISPVHLASRSRLEIGSGASAGQRVNGLYPGTYRGYNLKGYYNFYNIGSYADSYTTSPAARGMAYACGSKCGFSDSFNRPWDSSSKAILGGAEFLMNKYLDNKQDTIYFQKFNTSGFSNPYTNQYMQNIEAPKSEAGIMYSAYNSKGVLNNKIVFKIPVYNDMPVEVSALPSSGNPNNHLKDLKVNGQTVPNFSHDNNIYNINVPDNLTSINIEAIKINSKATVIGAGNIIVNPSVNKINIEVIAENKTSNTYTLNISYYSTEKVIMAPETVLNEAGIKNNESYLLGLKEGQSVDNILNVLRGVNNTIEVSFKNKTSGGLVTGDILLINSDNTVKEYNVVITGDADGDGLVTIVDLLRVQKHILGASSQIGSYYKAMDVDEDGKITIVDLLRVQKHILGVSKF